VLVEARWRDPARDDEHVAWTRAAHDALEPHTTGRAAINFLADDEGNTRRRAAFGENYERLATVEDRWDPEDLFGSHGPS